MDIPDDVVNAPPMMDTALLWIGFDQEATRERLRAEGFDTFDDLNGMKEKDIRDLADSYVRRTVADGRTIFGLKRTRYLIGLIHWVQDFARVGETPSLDGIEDAVQFKAVLDIASYRADVRKVEKEQSDTVSKAADPGKFKNERKWPEWEPAFVNYLSTLPGVNGVPLSYVVREKEAPEPGTEYGSFNEQAVACAPLTGPTFQADSRKVHQLLKSFLQTETAEQWIQPLARRQSGREDMKALRSHYSGEGNTTRRIADAERARDSLHYKNEKSMPFSTFLDNLQRMFNTFKTEGEEITEPAKVRILLKKVEHPQLQNAVSALRIRAQMDDLSFTDCANHLSSVVSELPDYQSNRKISGTDSNKRTKVKHIRGGGGGGKGGESSASKRKGIYMPDGSVWTGYYSDWDTMPEKEKNTVMETRKKNKEKGGTPHKKKAPNLKSQIADLKRSIAALKKTSDDETEDSSDAPDAPNNAGDAFGGRNKKKQKKE
ncbi:hypothetical protein MHU86_23277 [Fragilaria crotonensis]|nr:hypothetical protein MHU86_23277 [Fragilaria crotonensis]